MATLTHGNTKTSQLGGLAAAWRGLTERVADWSERRRQIARIEFELNTYSNRNLADLGLTRGDIGEVARGRFSR